MNPAEPTTGGATHPEIPQPFQMASLLGLPPKFQELIADQVIGATPSRATDLWYQDEEGAVHILRGGIEWKLNETAAALWLGLERGPAAIVKELCAAHAGTEPADIKRACAEFLLNAHSHGIIDLCPARMEG